MRECLRLTTGGSKWGVRRRAEQSPPKGALPSLALTYLAVRIFAHHTIAAPG
ncbi:hypothetical protein BDW02DRAFT_568590 [Decorospora gaudefroyi]|uniref:Uncharacterized protein n=1 Tax=Decorospora gaudefroyi TaxID=184978 RepID=A0A6A5KAI7_9PLEO|nr:hypothetical protein BDW02DRAFT_568590 [Decorospora gaudefroyi]